MKINLLTTIIVSFTLTLQAQFTVIQTSTTEILNDVSFVNAQVGFAVGENGAMVKTTDGGNNWTTLNINTTENLRKVQFIDSNTGFALSDSVFFKTNDGGMNFSSQIFNETLKDFHFISATEGKIAGYKNGAVVLSTTDGGNNFTSLTIEPSWYFWDSIQGIGIGNYYTLASIDYTNGRWEIGGSNYDYNAGEYPYALYSTNGTQWAEHYLTLNLAYGDTYASVIDVKTNSNGDVFHLKKPDNDPTYIYMNGVKMLQQPSGPSLVPLTKISEFGILNDSILLIPAGGNLRISNVNASLVEHNIDSIILTGGVGMVNQTIGFFTGENGKLAKYTDLSTFSPVVNEIDFKIFPSPADDYLIIEMENNAQLSIEIIDLHGRIVLQNTPVLNNRIDISMLSSGFYFIKLTDGMRNGGRKFIKK